MASLGQNFDAGNGPGMDDRSALPAGTYAAAICKSEIRQSKNKPQNSYINLEFEVMDGEHKGARFWTMLNLWNDNDTAVDIAQRELRSICVACGKLSVSDTEELHGIIMDVKVGVRQRDGYDPQNNVKGYAPMGEGRTGGKPAPVTASSGGSGGGKPWDKRPAA